MIKYLRRFSALLLALLMMQVPAAFAWTDQAHMAVGLAAGFRCFQNCAAADISHTIAAINGLSQTDRQGHFFNAPEDYAFSGEDVYSQMQEIGKSDAECPEGYLFGLILHTVRLCRERTEKGQYDDEYYAALLHYVADLAQPLHVSTYDDFNRSHHFACDNILSDKEAEYPVFAAIALAEGLTVEDAVCFASEEELVDAIVQLAKQSQQLAEIIRAEDRNLTREEAIVQLSRAATLGNAMLRYCGKIA